MPTCLAVLLVSLAAPAAGPYLGQPLPGAAPVLFAPGLVDTGLAARDVAISPDGDTFLFGVFLPGFRKAAVVEVTRRGGRWSAPEVASFSRDPRWRVLEPSFSPDGARLFFTSDRPADPAAERPGPFGLWVVARTASGWGIPERLPAAVNGEGPTAYPSVTRDGTLYFLREEGQGGWIMRSAFRDGAWRPAEKLPPPFNADPHQANPRVDADERMVLVPRADENLAADYFAYFRRDDGTWVGPVRLDAVSSPAGDEYSITPSPDGRVVFFGSDRVVPRLEGRPLTWRALLAERTAPGNGTTSIWWIDGGFLAEARRKALVEPAP